MAANKTIGGINVTITATIDKFQKNLTAARRMIGTFTKSISGLVFSLKGLAAALAVGGFAKLVADQMEAVNQLKDLSDKTGVTTDKLAGLQLAAEEAGVPIALLEKSLVKLNNEYGTRGDLALRQWIEKTSKLATHQEKLAAATEMFGSKGSSMVRFLQGGTAAIDEAQKAAESMGLAVTQDMAIGIDRASEAFARFKMSVSGIFRALAAEIAPFVELLSVKATSFLASNGQGKGIGTFIADVIVEMAKNVVDLIQKMVGGVLNVVADLQWMLHLGRTNSEALQSLGMGYSGRADWQSADDSAMAARARANAFNSGPVWKDQLQAWIEEARKQSAAQAKDVLASFDQGPDILSQLFGFGKRAGGGAATSIMQAASGIGNDLMRRLQVGSLQAGAMKFSGAGGFNSLGAQDPLSREGFSQRVRSVAQNDMKKIGQQQLKTQQNMAGSLQKLVANSTPRVAARI